MVVVVVVVIVLIRRRPPCGPHMIVGIAATGFDRVWKEYYLDYSTKWRVLDPGPRHEGRASEKFKLRRL